MASTAEASQAGNSAWRRGASSLMHRLARFMSNTWNDGTQPARRRQCMKYFFTLSAFLPVAGYANDVRSTFAATPPAITGQEKSLLNVSDYGMRPGNSATMNAVAWAAVHARYESLRGNSTIVIPAGAYQLDVSSGPFVLDKQNWSIEASGATIVPQNGGSVLRCQPSGDDHFPWGGIGQIIGLRVYTSANPSSGALIDVDNCTQLFLTNLTLLGGYRDLKVASSLQVHIEGLEAGGVNTNEGATIMEFGVGASPEFRNGNNSEISVANFNARSSVNGSYTHGLTISNADGIHFTSGHVGFTSGDAILIRPASTKSHLSGLVFVNVAPDQVGTAKPGRAAHGYHFVGISGYEGFAGLHRIAASDPQNISGSGIRVDDPALNGLEIFGGTPIHTGLVPQGGAGISIQAGKNITVVNEIMLDNGSNGASHIDVGGTASNVLIGNNVFSTWQSVSSHDISISGSASNVTVGLNLHEGSVGLPIYVAPGLANIRVMDSNVGAEAPSGTASNKP
jgi:hypothetical protein